MQPRESREHFPGAPREGGATLSFSEDQEAECLFELVREESEALHQFLGPGHFESVYENALANRLRKHALVVEQRFPLTVYDEDGVWLGGVVVDLLIEGMFVVQLKSCAKLRPEHLDHLRGCLRAARLAQGVVINFGASRLQLKTSF